MDLATDIGTNGNVWFGGRILFSSNGELCLSCKDLLNQEAIRQVLSTSGQREEDARIYGVPQEGLRTGPSVVSLNGIVASVAVIEFMAEVTGLRSAYRSLEYNGMMGRLTIDRDIPEEDCYYCKHLFNLRDDTNLVRYVQERWGQVR